MIVRTAGPEGDQSRPGSDELGRTKLTLSRNSRGQDKETSVLSPRLQVTAGGGYLPR